MMKWQKPQFHTQTFMPCECQDAKGEVIRNQHVTFAIFVPLQVGIEGLACDSDFLRI